MAHEMTFSSSGWSSEVVFSPSKARRQLAEAKDWQYIDTWLSAKYENQQMPPFERNSDTLKALLALAARNEAADEEAHLLTELELQALEELELRVGTIVACYTNPLRCSKELHLLSFAVRYFTLI